MALALTLTLPLPLHLTLTLTLTRRVSSANYADGVASLGETGMVELVSIVGYYSYLALTLNTFEIEDPHAPDACVGEGGRSCAKSPWEADAALVG